MQRFRAREAIYEKGEQILTEQGTLIVHMLRNCQAIRVLEHVTDYRHPYHGLVSIVYPYLMVRP